MRKKTVLILFVLFLLNWSVSIGQDKISVSKPMLEIQNGNLIIKYDILNSKPGEKYNISIEITDSGGEVIMPASITGDMGDNIEGGKDKRIIWHFDADNIKDQLEISVSIILRVLEKPLTEKQPPQVKSLSRGNLVLQSVALPGWGLSSLHKKKPYWIIGIAGYGIIAGSVIYHQASRVSYNDFLDTDDPGQESIYYDKYKSQKTISMAGAIGAATIWVADLIWIYSASSKQNNQVTSSRNKLSLLPDYDLRYNLLGFQLKYTF